VAVKKGVAKNVAICLSAPEARRRIREGVATALRQHRRSPIAPPRLDPPYTKDVRYFITSDADGAQSRGAQRLDDQTVRYHSDRYEDVLFEHLRFQPAAGSQA
jgi:D-aminopeptidase